MRKSLLHIACLLASLLPVFSCSRSLMEPDAPETLPDGVPVTLTIPFSGTDLYEVTVGTKAEASSVNETHVHDLYVMIFDNTDLVGDNNDSPRKIYGRFFSYEHLKESLSALNADDNECWYVENKNLEGTVAATTGAVKVSTITCSDARLVVIANVTNAIMNLDGEDALDRLKEVTHYKELQGIEVRLEQDIVNRKDLFLMKGELAVNTASMNWGTLPKNYDPDYTVSLVPVDAKVKFRVKVNSTNISAVTPVYWQVHNTPDRCYLDSSYNGEAAPSGNSHFDSQQYYFEGTEEKDGYTWYTFCFYMLENRESPNGTATSYYQRELRDKIDSGESGYKGPTGPDSDGFSDHYVDNGDWRYAPTFGTYVTFDLVLTLTEAGIDDIGGEDPEGMEITQALTSDAIFTVHLGDFTSSATGDADALNDYNTLRGHSYTYNITINNTRSIYAEVKNDNEVQSGQEGFLLLTDAEIINADCHYEYHQIEFEYRRNLSQEKFSWYVKTPFGEGGPKISYNTSTGKYSYDASGLDYLWVKFGVNGTVDPSYTSVDPSDENPDPPAWYSDITGDYVCPYTNKRHAYPGDSHYHPEWEPGQTVNDGDGKGVKSVPDLMDITQLIEYIFYETAKEDAVAGSSDFIADDDGISTTPVIRVTAFINEYYYEEDPLNPGSGTDPELWRKFVNANPREMHILSDAQSSRDRKSDVILSSHSIIQQSIQTIYNVYAADLHSLWGTEHLDEMRAKTDGWPYWPAGLSESARSGSYNTLGLENGRLNTGYIWGFWSSNTEKGSDVTGKTWATYMNYDVHNNIPELRQTYQGMAWSCLTRNRDNNGDGVVDRNEVRWYLASANQLAGMWVGNESLSINARLYQPAEGQWRAHVISSTDQRVSWTEEGGGATAYTSDWQSGETWKTQVDASRGESVRCLRNIGTYSNGGTLTDITEAPYTVQPERYFTITPEPSDTDPADTRYEFHFDRINPKSLRQLATSELPYHDQFNVNNCVYLKMETQSREDELLIEPGSHVVNDKTYTVKENHTYSVRNDEINPVVTQLGYNPFCPPGYRFPNHSEILLMSLYLPGNYHSKNSEDNSYSGVTVYSPSRTYYDRGIYGKITTGFEFDPYGKTTATTREQNKTGWGWSDKLHCAKNKDAMTVSRCVRDVDMTGTIEGGILVADELYPGDAVPLSFSFYSSGATFISASLKFCYTDKDGIYHERDIPVQKTPTGLEFLADQTYVMPSLSVMNLTEDVLDNNGGELRNKVKFKMTLRNAYASQTFEQPFTLGNPLEGSFSLAGDHVLMPSGDKEMDFNISSKANTCHLDNVTLKLKYKNSSDVDTEKTLDIPDDYTYLETLSYVHLNEAVSIPELGELGLSASDLPRTASLELTVTDHGGSSKTFTINKVGSKNLQLGEDTTPSFDGFRIKATVADTRVTFHANYREYLYYSTDGGETWTVPTGTAITLANVGDEICVLGRKDNYKNAREENDSYGAPKGNPLFSTADNKLVYICGNIMSLLCRPDAADYAHPENWTIGTTLSEDAFNGTFSRGSTTPITYINIDPTDPLLLPATTLAARCYKSMFRCCTSLTVGPDLPATTLVEKCYSCMFRACPNITYLRCYFTTYNGGGVDNKDNYSRTALEGFLDKWFYENSPYTNTATGTIYCHPDMITYWQHAKVGNSSWYFNNQIATIPANWTVSEWTPAP